MLIYFVDLLLTSDNNAGADLYLIRWMRERQVVPAADVTDGPFIKTFDLNTGEVLIPLTQMNAMGIADKFSHIEIVKRLAPGHAIIVEFTAKIDGSPRGWRFVLRAT